MKRILLSMSLFVAVILLATTAYIIFDGLNDNVTLGDVPRYTSFAAAGFLKEGMEAKLTMYENEPIDIELPTTVDLKVTKAEAAVKGDTATGVTKRVTTETGAIVDVPYFVSEGDIIRVDTRDGSYVTRVSA